VAGPPTAASDQPAPPQAPPPAVAVPGPPGAPIATIRARSQEKAGDLYTLRGEVEIDYKEMVLRADEVTYNAATGQVTATGHLVMEGGPHDEHIEASHGEYNLDSESGKLYDVVGTTGARFRGRTVALTSSNPFAFSGAVVEKRGPDLYIVEHGTVTSCELPSPKWTFSASRIVVNVSGSAHIYNSAFRVKKVPVFWFPFASHPAQKLGRQSGFLVPSGGTSSRKGIIVGESIYWAINRSMDATLGAAYFSQRGWAQTGEFRAKPSDTSYISASYYGVLDRGIGSPPQDQGGQDIHVNAYGIFPHDIRGVVSANYLSSLTFREAFGESFTQAVNSEAKTIGFLSKNYDGYSFNLMAARYQNFQSTAPGDVISILHTPSGELSSVDRRIGSTPLTWSFDAAAEGVHRSTPTFKSDDVVGRFDLQPTLALPLHAGGWSFRPEATLRETYYTERVPGGNPTPNINRFAIEGSFELRPPSLSRIYQLKSGRSYKHVIEPRVIYRYVSGVDNFTAILRFDERDILSDTHEVEYGVVNRLYTKSAPADCEEPVPAPAAAGPLLGQAAPPPPPAEEAAPPACGSRVRELLTWEIAQKYFIDPNFGNSVVPGTRNVFTTTVDFTGMAFLTGPRRFSPVLSKLRLQTSAHTDLDWHLDYDPVAGRINSSFAFFNYHFGNWFLGGAQAFLQTPLETSGSGASAASKFNQFRILAGYGHPNKRGLNAAANIGFDSNLQFLQYGAFQWSYNWDCCGVSMEYRRFALGSVRNENQYRFAFTLANIGTFGNMKRQERLF
jgi:LPS-assembly protein